VITSEIEYEKALEELDYLGRWLANLERKQGADRRPLTTAGIRKMIARIQEEVADYEAMSVSTPPTTGRSSRPDDPGIGGPE